MRSFFYLFQAENRNKHAEKQKEIAETEAKANLLLQQLEEAQKEKAMILKQQQKETIADKEKLNLFGDYISQLNDHQLLQDAASKSAFEDAASELISKRVAIPLSDDDIKSAAKSTGEFPRLIFYARSQDLSLQIGRNKSQSGARSSKLSSLKIEKLINLAKDMMGKDTVFIVFPENDNLAEWLCCLQKTTLESEIVHCSWDGAQLKSYYRKQGGHKLGVGTIPQFFCALVIFLNKNSKENPINLAEAADVAKSVKLRRTASVGPLPASITKSQNVNHPSFLAENPVCNFQGIATNGFLMNLQVIDKNSRTFLTDGEEVLIHFGMSFPSVFIVVA